MTIREFGGAERKKEEDEEKDESDFIEDLKRRAKGRGRIGAVTAQRWAPQLERAQRTKTKELRQVISGGPTRRRQVSSSVVGPTTRIFFIQTTLLLLFEGGTDNLSTVL